VNLNSKSKIEKNIINIEPIINSEDHELYKKIINYIEKEDLYLNPELSQTMLADTMGIAVYKLSNIVNKYYGAGHTDLINGYRVKHAQKLLADKEYNKYSNAGIAKLSGFNSEAHFYLIYKKLTGVTPTLLRNKAQSEEIINEENDIKSLS
jgi:AraC-like DNA-binding protein